MTGPHIAIAGAGIGGLTTALTLAGAGFRVTVFEQSARLEETGAGIQLSPNAARVLSGLGLGAALRRVASVPQNLIVRAARTGRTIACMPLGAALESRYGAPYWMLHRADLQSVLMAAATVHPNIRLVLGAKLEDYALNGRYLTVRIRSGEGPADQQASALIGADGLWSSLRVRVGDRAKPRFQYRSAWRSLPAASEVPEAYREPAVQLWLGRSAHLVHYPVRGGAAVNIVAIHRDLDEQAGWSGQGSRDALLSQFSAEEWAPRVRELIAVPRSWQRWGLYDLPPLRCWGEGPVTLTGDAAHPMLPFLAQGAAMAIEDAAVLAHMLTQSPNDPAAAFRRYEDARQARVAKVQRAARQNGRIYHLSGIAGLARNAGMRLIGGEALIGRYGWIFGWHPPRGAAPAVVHNPAERGL